MTPILRRAWDRASIYLPIILMGLFALGTWWLVRSVPETLEAGAARPVRHEPDYFMRKFAIRTFNPDGRLRSELFGAEVHHFPDTDTLEIDQVRIRSFDDNGLLTVATARRALSNADGTDVQLLGDAQVVRESGTSASGAELPRLEFRGEYLHADGNAKRLKSHLPVTLRRGADQFTAEAMDYDDRSQVLELHGQVRGMLPPRAQAR